MAGALQMSEDELWNTTPRVLVWKYQGLIETQEALLRTTWEAARFQSVAVLNSQGAKIKDARRVIKFPWETGSSFKLTEEDIDRLKNKFKKWL